LKVFPREHWHKLSPIGQKAAAMFMAKSIKVYEPGEELDSVPGCHVDPCDTPKSIKSKKKRQPKESSKQPPTFTLFRKER